MASLLARTAHPCRTWSCAVAGMWRSVGGSLSSIVRLYWSCCDQRQAGRVLSGADVSIAADALVDIPLSGALPKTETIGADRQVCDRNAYPLRKSERFRVYLTPGGVAFASLKPPLCRRALNEEATPVGMCMLASRNVTQKSCHDSPGEGVFCGKERPSGSSYGRGNIDLPSASTTSEAITIVKHRQQQGLYIGSHMFVEILKWCSKQKDLVAARQLHQCVIQSGMDKNPYVMNTLLNVYIRCRRLKDARQVFETLEKKDVVTWRIMIAGYAENGHAQDAMEVFNRMRQGGAQPNEITCLSILKACVSRSALKWGREVHAYIRRNSLDSNVRVGTAVVHMYAKCGCITQSRRVFEKLTSRDVITWNVMIGAYAESGLGVEAYRLFIRMIREGFIPNAITYTSILNASASAGALEWVKDVHGHACRAGLESDVRVGNAIVHMYGKSGSIDDARAVFDRLKKRDVTTWTIMIGGYAEIGRGLEGYRLFLRMKREGFIPDAITYLSMLNASASAGALDWVKEVHGHARRARLNSDVRVGNALVRMYAKSGSVGDARLVFDKMEKRDVITWNIMIGAYAGGHCGLEAYRLFLEMKREGFTPDAITYLSILNASASVGALEWLKEVHGHARSVGLELDFRVCNALIHMYWKSGSIEDARLVFDKMGKRDVVTWTTMIGAYAESGCGVEAYRLFLQMKREGFQPNAITFVSILNASASVGALKWVRDVHVDIRRGGLESALRVGAALVRMYAKSGSIDEARLVFDRMEKRDVVIWNIMIGAYAESGCGWEAYRLFLQMKRDGFVADAVTYVSILNPAASPEALDWVKEVHGHAFREGLELDVRVSNALVHMYVKSGSIDDARLVFVRMAKRDVITWNIMIGAYAESGCGAEAYRLFLEMEREGFKPDAITYMNILNASASAGALEWVKKVHSHAHEAGLESDLRVSNALVHMYAKSGSIDDSRLIFERMKKRDVVTFNVMIGGLAQHGRGHEALILFQRMNADCVKPDGTLFLAVLSACCHAGLVDDGRRLFSAMMQDYGVKPTVIHYNCMVDLLGRAGHLEEAKLLIRDMPVEPDGVTWKSLLGACRTHGNVELGEVAANAVFKLEPKDASAYVLLSNIYAAAGRWEKVSSVRSIMQERGVRKEPGRSWIEVDNKIHEFVAGDTCHPEAKVIYTELNELTKKLKAEGYIPDSQLVLHNIDEEDRELTLCSHSEKLAIAYGILRVPPGKPIRVFKNLRVCADCHTATKLLSKVTGRVIIAKDANRFHHFKDGVCSCGDYW